MQNLRARVSPPPNGPSIANPRLEGESLTHDAEALTKRVSRRVLHAEKVVLGEMPAVPPALWETNSARRPEMAQDGPGV